MRRPHALFVTAFVTLAACGQPDPGTSDPALGGPAVEIEIAALTLSGVSDAVWDIQVISQCGTSTGETIFSQRVTSSGFGDGAGSATYVGPCDASDPGGTCPNDVVVRLVGIYDQAVATPGEHGSGDPATSLVFSDPGTLTRSFTCAENQDTLVAFDVTVLRPARQGFFDIAVSFTDIFCSAKLDCVYGDGGPITLVHDAAGERGPTAVFAIACTAGADTAGDDVDTTIHLDDLQIACGGTPANVTLSPAPATLGNQYSPPNAAGTSVIYQAQVFGGVESIVDQSSGLDANKLFWSVALGVDLGALATAPATGCNVTTSFTASQGVNDVLWTPSGIYPVIAVNVPLTVDGGELACGGDNAHGLDELLEAGLGYLETDYPQSPRLFDNCAHDGGGGQLAFCPPILCDEDEYVASNVCVPCPPDTTNEAGDDAAGPDTTCDPVQANAIEVYTFVDEFGYDYYGSAAGYFDDATKKIAFRINGTGNQARIGVMSLDNATKQGTVLWVSDTMGDSNNLTLAQLTGRNFMRGRRIQGQWDNFLAGYEIGDAGLIATAGDLNQGNQRYILASRLTDTRGFAWSSTNFQSVRMADYTGGTSFPASAISDFGQTYTYAEHMEWDGDLVVHTKLGVTNTAGTLLLFQWSGSNGAGLSQFNFHNIIPSGMSSASAYGTPVRTSYGAFILNRQTANTWRITRSGTTLTLAETGTWSAPAVPLLEIRFQGLSQIAGKHTWRPAGGDVWQTVRVYDDAGTGRMDSVLVDLSNFASPTVSVVRADIHTWDATAFNVPAQVFFPPGTADIIFTLYNADPADRTAKIIYVQDAF